MGAGAGVLTEAHGALWIFPSATLTAVRLAQEIHIVLNRIDWKMLEFLTHNKDEYGFMKLLLVNTQHHACVSYTPGGGVVKKV